MILKLLQVFVHENGDVTVGDKVIGNEKELETRLMTIDQTVELVKKADELTKNN